MLNKSITVFQISARFFTYLMYMYMSILLSQIQGVKNSGEHV